MTDIYCPAGCCGAGYCTCPADAISKIRELQDELRALVEALNDTAAERDEARAQLASIIAQAAEALPLEPSDHYNALRDIADLLAKWKESDRG